ncbi:thioesterase domain-containing protein [Spongiactinospora sp. TRM90649]|uniref:thioesterase II family protein n=1 Tax=Spongiactinospora sp. TRM90649 TaxID=3031114 RepID=UPI0023F8E61A|nr:thioesterase domain-containing protein [Spongiactinospora sp. TRM90649]MDF5757680.1 thioesterase domain-containing protein [Spongiactinospora sp. TRM90649]
MPEHPPNSPKVRLLVVPHAGGGAATANRFRDAAPAAWSVGAVLFGGRESRFADDPPSGFAEMVDDVVAAASAMPPHGVPLVLAGQCSGAKLAFEAARLLRRRGEDLAGLVVLSSPPPDGVASGPDTTLPDERFAEEVVRLGGVPAEVAELPDLLELLVPALRADFAALASYRTSGGPPLDRPVLVLHSPGDPGCDREAVRGWAVHAKETAFAETDGGHFLLGEQPSAVASLIGRWIAEWPHDT